MPAAFTQLEKTIGITFRNKDILAEALTHRSASKQQHVTNHNERLEFLGDAVLELISTEYLFSFKNKNEGELTNWRAALVRGENLANVANTLNLGDYLFMSKGEEASGGRSKESTLANALEALIGAIHVDRGYDEAQKFVANFILKDLQDLLAKGKDRDAKSRFQEKSQELLNVTPHYDMVSESGPDHDKTFVCALFIGEERIAEGNGASKQKAELDAAVNGMEVKGW
jgi:ribonuclease-3